MKQIIAAAVLIILLYGCKSTQRAASTEKHTSFRYHKNDPVIHSKLVVSEPGKTLALLHFKEEIIPEELAYRYKIYDPVDTKKIDEGLPEKAFTGSGILELTFPAPKIDSAIVLIEVFEPGKPYKTVLDFYFDQESLSNYIYLTRDDLPVFNYISGTSEISFKKLPGAPDSVTIYSYKHTFIPSLPPVPDAKIDLQKQMEIQSIRKVSTSATFHPDSYGLFYFTWEKGSANGFSIHVAERSYPEMTSAGQLIKPLIYLTNNKEYRSLLSSENPKKELDEFWIRTGGSKTYARDLIQAFYSNVEDANRLFTSYKEGWKTDRGMLYIVFGPPDWVYKSKSLEQWIYMQAGSWENVIFEFERKENPFARENYELIRKDLYEPIWYNGVERWRKGIMVR